MASDQPLMLTHAAEPDARKRFTLEDANRALPLVGRIASDVVESYHRIVDLRRELEQDGSRDLAEAERDYEHEMDRLSDLVDELHLVGVELRDFELGVIDFPAWYAGHEVLLTWRHGEERVSFWHEPGDAFGSQRSIEELAA